MELKDQWSLETAMQVLENKIVDSKLWAEAVEWLMLYGPEEIRQILLQSSGVATNECFPDLKAAGYAPDGQPCYNVAEIAEALKISKNEAKEIIMKKQQEHQVPHFIDEDETHKMQ